MTEETFRKMASIQRIEEVKSIPEADRICAYRVSGWWIVDQVGKYQIGDLVVYCEIDSFLPSAVAPFLTKPGKFPKEYLGVSGERLKTVRLKKQLSQGLLLPIAPTCDCIESELFVGLDVTFPLGIQKWEPPPEFTAANARGNFPKFIFKTDQERIQNCYNEVKYTFQNLTYQCSEKIEGQSHTSYFYNGEFGVCSRNLNLKDDDNTFWNTARKYNLQEKLESLGRNIAIQSEQIGPGISGNIYKSQEYYLLVYDIFDIDEQKYLSPIETQKVIQELGLTSVPILESECSLANMTLDEILVKADGYSVLGLQGCRREGMVFKANCSERISWKSVSNEYLLSV